MPNLSDSLSPMRPLLVLFASLLVSLSPGCTSQPGVGACRTVLNCKDDASPICDANSLSCRACQPGTDDTACKNRDSKTPRCGSAGRCVGCLTSNDCKGLSTPTCSSQNVCTGCLQATDCPSRVCNADHSCAPQSDVIYVDNKNGSCAAVTHSGALDDPFCLIQDAVTAAVNANKAVISVTPSTKAYEAVTISNVGSAGLSISSSGGTASPVQIRGTNNAAVSVTVAAGTKVLLTDLDLAASSGNGLDCSGGADLTLLTSRVHHSVNGIVVNGCVLTLDGVRVYKNDNNGIYLQTSTAYSLNNLMIWNNNASGIALQASGQGTLRFVTVYANGNPSLTQPPGIDCGAGSNMIDNAIVFNNISSLSGNLLDKQTQGCTLNNVVTNDSKSGTYKTQIDFVNALGGDPSMYDLRLKSDSAANADCCIDKVLGAAPIDHDIDNNRRPQGNGSDIGASEVR